MTTTTVTLGHFPAPVVTEGRSAGVEAMPNVSDNSRGFGKEERFSTLSIAWNHPDKDIASQGLNICEVRTWSSWL